MADATHTQPPCVSGKGRVKYQCNYTKDSVFVSTFISSIHHTAIHSSESLPARCLVTFPLNDHSDTRLSFWEADIDKRLTIFST